MRSAYPRSWPLYAATRTAAARWRRRGLLTADQYTAIEAASPLPFYRPAFWVRVTLFLFTLLAVAMAGGTIGLFFLTGFERSPIAFMHVLLLLYAGGAGLALEQVIQHKQHYYSGVDNALLYTALSASAWLLGLLYFDLTGLTPDFNLGSALLGFGLPVLALQVVALARYADPLVAATAYLTYLALVLGALALTPLGLALLPFGGMIASALAYWALTRQVAPRLDPLIYGPAFETARVLALTALYLSGNYLLVREGNGALHHRPTAEPIALAGFFWAWTVGLPLAYVAAGLRRADRPLLLTGLAAAAVAAYTYRTYYSVLPPAWAATLGGLVLTGAALALLRYLRPARHGLTSDADDAAPPTLNLEALIVAQQAPDLPTGPPPVEGFQGFGGGQLGGGGAGGTF